MAIDISAIICTRDRRDSLARTLDSLKKLEVSPDTTYEVLIIDNGSADNTRELLDDFAQTNPEIYKCYCQPKKGRSNALNLGILQSRGKIIAFTDDDVVVDKNWVWALKDAFNIAEEAIAVQGKILLQEEIAHIPPWVNPEDLLLAPYYAPGDKLCRCDKLVGANMAVRRIAFERYGLFDTRLGAGASGLGEETEFCARLRRGDEIILYQPDAVVFHEYRPERFTWEYWLQRIQQEAYSQAIIDTILNERKIGRIAGWMKLMRYHIKYSLYALSGNNRMKWKYDRKVRKWKNYMHYASKLHKGLITASNT